MKSIPIYEDFGELECLAGDTLPTMRIDVETSSSLTGCTMQLVVADHADPTSALLTKPCERVEGGFVVQLTSDDTQDLGGRQCDLHFRLIGADEHVYRRLRGTLFVHHVAKGGTST